MSALPYHKRYHGDALTGFMALTLEERGAYQTLLDMMYDRGGPLIDNERLLAGYMNCSIRKWRQIRESLIEKGKIRINAEGQIANRRAQKEIENTTKTQRKLIEAGSKGGRKRAENEKKDNENNESDQASLELGLSDPQAIPEARSQSSVSEDTGVKPPDPVKIIFDLGIAMLAEQGFDERRARSLIGSWRKGRSDGDVVAALIDAQARSISSLAEWMPKRLGNASNGSGASHRNHEDVVLERIERERRRSSDVATG